MTNDSEASPNGLDHAASAAPLSPRRRFQFSLATLLWLTTLAVCLAALWAMYRDLQKAESELQTARDEVQKYRGEMGYLEISDRNKIYARAIKTTTNDQWSWRFYLPQVERYQVLIATDRISTEGFPDQSASIGGISPGEHRLDAFWEPGHDDKWRLHDEFDRDGNVMDCVMQPLNQNYAPEANGVVGADQVIGDPGVPFELIRYLTFTTQAASGSEDRMERCDGLMIWVEPQK